MKLKILLASSMFALAVSASAQTGYGTSSQIGARLKSLPAKSKLVKVSTIGKSSGGKEIVAVTLSNGATNKNKALLIVAGADGKHPAGSEMATKLAENLVNLPGDSLTNLLKTTTLYIIPALNPDALDQLGGGLKYERSGNATKRDDDRDGRLDEDPFEDLNKDGLITAMRVLDPTGKYIVSKEDSRLMVKADASKGEKGKYIVLTEGFDNDKDGKFNEDGEGGVNIDKNFTFDYPMFEQEAGEYQASEPETQAFLDFLYKNTNIHTVLHFGLSNNLSEATKFDRAKASKRIISGLLEKDAAVTELVSSMYTKTGNSDAPALAQKQGNLTQTAYYHAGRFSYVTPGWWVPKMKDAKDTTKKATPTRGGSNTELNYLKWAEANNVNAFVNWTPINNHPDFPDKTVEVGGFVPNALNNPPVQFLEPSVEKHQAFLAEYIKAMPQTEIVNTKVESLGNNVNRVTITVLNNGVIPTYPEIGDRIRYIYKVSAKLKLAPGQTLISGNKNNYRSRLGGGESQEYSWLINGKGNITIEAGCPTAGISNLELTLK